MLHSIKRWLAVAFVAAAASFGAVSLASSATPLSIAIQGNHWVNGSGQTVVLRGANTEGTQYDCAQKGAGFFDDSTISGTNFTTEINALKAWGINVVRVNLNEQCWLGINGVPASTSVVQANGYDAYANTMGSYVSALNAAGIYAEVDLHLNAPSSELISDVGNNDDQNPLPESNSDAFWKSVGTYFASNPAVIFGAFNEPFPLNYNTDGDTAAIWKDVLNGVTIPHDCTKSSGNCKGTPYAGEGMKQMVQDIRSVDATTPILVGGPDFAGDMDQWMQTFEPNGVSIDPSNQLAASVHIYFPKGNSPCAGTTNVLTSCTGLTAAAAKVPVLVDELGDFGCKATSLTPFLASIDAENASAGTDIGWVGWSWTTDSCDPNMITSFKTGKPSTMGAAEYCNLHADGLNPGTLTTCKAS